MPYVVRDRDRGDYLGTKSTLVRPRYVPELDQARVYYRKPPMCWAPLERYDPGLGSRRPLVLELLEVKVMLV